MRRCAIGVKQFATLHLCPDNAPGPGCLDSDNRMSANFELAMNSRLSGSDPVEP